jgi:hypothetical protein
MRPPQGGAAAGARPCMLDRRLGPLQRPCGLDRHRLVSAR